MVLVVGWIFANYNHFFCIDIQGNIFLCVKKTKEKRKLSQKKHLIDKNHTFVFYGYPSLVIINVVDGYDRM